MAIWDESDNVFSSVELFHYPRISQTFFKCDLWAWCNIPKGYQCYFHHSIRLILPFLLSSVSCSYYFSSITLILGGSRNSKQHILRSDQMKLLFPTKVTTKISGRMAQRNFEDKMGDKKQAKRWWKVKFLHNLV